MTQTKVIPARMCVVCRQMKPKTELVRLVKTNDTGLIDNIGKMQGRGVYVCKCSSCVEKLCKNKSLSKLLGFTLDESLMEKLKEIVK